MQKFCWKHYIPYVLFMKYIVSIGCKLSDYINYYSVFRFPFPWKLFFFFHYSSFLYSTNKLKPSQKVKSKNNSFLKQWTVETVSKMTRITRNKWNEKIKKKTCAYNKIWTSIMSFWIVWPKYQISTSGLIIIEIFDASKKRSIGSSFWFALF